MVACAHGDWFEKKIIYDYLKLIEVLLINNHCLII